MRTAWSSMGWSAQRTSSAPAAIARTNWKRITQIVSEALSQNGGHSKQPSEAGERAEGTRRMDFRPQGMHRVNEGEVALERQQSLLLAQLESAPDDAALLTRLGHVSKELQRPLRSSARPPTPPP